MARSYRELRAWQEVRTFKRAIYGLLRHPPLAGDSRLSSQLREAAASAQSCISEGFGRFDPADFARLVKMARASVLECLNHLEDAVDRGHIPEDTRGQYDSDAQAALKEIGGLLDYLQSPEAKRNTERIRQARFERRRNRTTNPEQ